MQTSTPPTPPPPPTCLPTCTSSVRGYSHGELGAARRFVEGAAEVRLPLKNYGLPGTAYAFAEYGTDLGSRYAALGTFLG